MRFNKASSSSLVVATIALGACYVVAQEAGDPVTYTDGRVVYTAVLDPDLDTVSDRPVSTIAAAAAAGLLSTSTDAAGDVITYSDGDPVGTLTAAVAGAGPLAGAGPTTTSTTAQRGGVSLVAGQTEEDLHFDEPLSLDAALGMFSANDAGVASGHSSAPSSNDDTDSSLHQPHEAPSSVEFIHFQTFERRSPTPTLRSPDQQREYQLEKRQAALGGGGGDVQTTQASLQVISGYTPPESTVAPSPTNFSSGQILAPSDIPGYTGKENSQGVSGAATIKLNPYMLAMGCMTGAAVFVFGL